MIVSALKPIKQSVLHHIKLTNNNLAVANYYMQNIVLNSKQDCGFAKEAVSKQPTKPIIKMTSFVDFADLLIFTDEAKVSF